MAARQRGDLPKAKAIFLQMLQNDPKSGGAFEGLSLVCLSLGEYAEALSYLKRWDAQSPHSAYILGLMTRAREGLSPVGTAAAPPYDEGMAARQRGDLHGAKAIFLKMLKRDPKSGGAFEGLSLVCLSLGEYAEALSYLKRWDAQSPHSAYILDLMARAREGLSPVGTAAPAPAAPSYDEGMVALQHGDLHGAKVIFLKMLEREPKSNGALEGLSLVCLSLGEYREALGYLKTWNAQSPHSAYILNLMARAQKKLRDNTGVQVALAGIAEAEPCDPENWRKLDDPKRSLATGMFPTGRIYKTLSQEELNTSTPQRIIYEGRSGGLRARYRSSPELAFIGGAEYAQEAQRNDTNNAFTYYDILDQRYSLGLEANPTRDVRLEGEYGQSLLNDIQGAGLGRTKFSRARLFGEWDTQAGDARLTLTRTPKYLRGAGPGNLYFGLLREDDVQGEFETDIRDVGLLARAGLSNYSERTTTKNWSLLATKEWGVNLLQARYARSQQEFYGATPDGRLGYVDTDRIGIKARRLQEDKYLLSLSYGRTFFADANRTDDFNAEATGWLPWCKEFSGSYRLSTVQYLVPTGNYISTNEQDHWLGGYWRRGWNRACPCCWGCGAGEGTRPRRYRGLWSMVGYEHGFIWDAVRNHYESNVYLGELEWYQRENLSFRAQGRESRDTVHDQSYSLGLQARYSF